MSSNSPPFAYVPNLHVDPARFGSPDKYAVTGICVMAACPDGEKRWVDLGQLDELSVVRWMRSEKGQNPKAERVVLYLLGWKPHPA